MVGVDVHLLLVKERDRGSPQGAAAAVVSSPLSHESWMTELTPEMRGRGGAGGAGGAQDIQQVGGGAGWGEGGAFLSVNWF